MLNRTFKPALLLGILSITNFCAFAQNSFNVKNLDSLLNYFESNNKMMGSITLSKNNKVFYSKAFGYSQIDEKSKHPATIYTRYRIGSITKMFTSVMILQLIEEKKLNLDTKLSTYFPKIKNANIITIEQLLSHRSGIHNFTSVPDYLEWNIKAATQQQMLYRIEKMESDFEPGKKYEYSNTNYVLLGYIIEKATGKAYAEELKNRITNKIGLKNTYYGAKTDVNNNEAFSYTFNNEHWVQEAETDMSIPHGAGAIVSTPSDLSLFIEVLFSNKLVNEKSLKEMMTIKNGYGFGMIKVPFYDKFAYGHNGGIDGFSSMLTYFPNDSMTLAFTENGANYPMNDILIGVLSIVYNKPYKFPSFKTINIPSETLAKYEGVYSTAKMPMQIIIKKDGGNLTAQATGQSAFILDAVSETEFKFDMAGIIMKFNKTKEDDIDAFMLKQGGGEFLFQKGKAK